MLALIFPSSSLYAKQKGTLIHIPVETIEALKATNLNEAARTLRMEAFSPISKFILRQIEGAILIEKTSGKRNLTYSKLYNAGAAYHNLLLFLKRHDFESKPFFKKALKYYNMAEKKVPADKSARLNVIIAALYGDIGKTDKAKKLFGKIKFDFSKINFRYYETIALYYASINDAENAVINLQEAYKSRPQMIKFWLGITDDFVTIENAPEYQQLIKKWKIERLDKGSPNY